MAELPGLGWIGEFGTHSALLSTPPAMRRLQASSYASLPPALESAPVLWPLQGPLRILLGNGLSVFHDLFFSKQGWPWQSVYPPLLGVPTVSRVYSASWCRRELCRHFPLPTKKRTALCAQCPLPAGQCGPSPALCTIPPLALVTEPARHLECCPPCLVCSPSMKTRPAGNFLHPSGPGLAFPRCTLRRAAGLEGCTYEDTDTEART